MGDADIASAVKRDFPGLTDLQTLLLYNEGFDRGGAGMMSALASGFQKADQADCSGASASIGSGGAILAIPTLLTSHARGKLKRGKKVYCWVDTQMGAKQIAWESEWQFRAPAPAARARYAPNIFVRQLLLRFNIGYNPRRKEVARLVEIFNESWRVDRTSGHTILTDPHWFENDYAPEYQLGGFCEMRAYEVGYLQLVKNDVIGSNVDDPFYGGGGYVSNDGGNTWAPRMAAGAGTAGRNSTDRGHDNPLNVSGKYEALYAPCHCGVGPVPELVPEAPGKDPSPYPDYAGEPDDRGRGVATLGAGQVGIVGTGRGPTRVLDRWFAIVPPQSVFGLGGSARRVSVARPSGAPQVAPAVGGAREDRDDGCGASTNGSQGDCNRME